MGRWDDGPGLGCVWLISLMILGLLVSILSILWNPPLPVDGKQKFECDTTVTSRFIHINNKIIIKNDTTYRYKKSQK
jgi:hypothetical protein